MKLENAEVSVEETGVYVVGYLNNQRIKIKTQNLYRGLESIEEEEFAGKHKHVENVYHWVYFPLDRWIKEINDSNRTKN